MINLRILLCVLLIFVGSLGVSQESYSIGEISIWITGTSTLHDWNVTAEDVSNYPDQLSITDAESIDIKDFSFQVAVESMDGGRGATMNKKIYTALKSEAHPYVVFDHSGPSSLSKSSDNELNGQAQGVINIGGFENEVVVDIKGMIDGSSIKFKGEVPLKLSQFAIDPPSAMFGQIQTKDDITVHFEISYNRDK